MKRFVYNEKYVKLLVKLLNKKSRIDELAKDINANPGHLRIVLEQWHKEKVIEKNQPGREYEITLTQKGKAIAKKLAELIQLVNNWKEKPTTPIAPIIPKNANVTQSIGGSKTGPNQGRNQRVGAPAKPNTNEGKNNGTNE